VIIAPPQAGFVAAGLLGMKDGAPSAPPATTQPTRAQRTAKAVADAEASDDDERESGEGQ
jgi:hypothetical protein